VTALDIRGLTLELPSAGGHSPILRGVDLALQPGRIHGLAGESGSGKTMTGLAVLGLLPPGARTGGQILLDDTDLLALTPSRLNTIRGRRVGMVFQDPSSSLHPMLSVGRQLTDHVRHHLDLDRKAARARAADLLAQVRIPNPGEALDRYPHQFSGGMRQRIAIAIAVACDPKVLIADEPTTALDVTVQAGVLRLLRRLCDELDLAILLVTHDLGVMSALADHVSVMRDGLVVETGERARVLTDPQHPYTRSLLDALPGHARAAGTSDAGPDDAAPGSSAQPTRSTP
jgi:ABC-type dipeptide/oligopeptide/nickel transport system ATPase component